MMSRYTPEQTHRIMSSVHSKDTNIELVLRKALWNSGIRYRKNLKTLPGKPDIAITKYKIAVFCDAEFWHGKDWDALKRKLQQGTNPDFWISKIERTRQRDTETDRALRMMGWTVLRFWGQEILKDADGCVAAVQETIFDIVTNDRE